ncbi:hypothetical protein MBLNU230_g3186t1 [Neophaeotheca triangularis]
MDDTTWTPVTSKKRKTPNPNTTKPPTTPPVPQPNPIDRTATTASLLKEYTTQSRRWLHSPCKTTVQTNLHTFLRSPDLQITKAVILGSGSFCRDNLSWRRKSLLQLAAFVDMAGIVGAGGGGAELFAQEPEYVGVDSRLLAELGVRVVRHPAAQELFDRGAFVFAPFLELGLGVDSEAFLRRVGCYVGNCLCEATGPMLEKVEVGVREKGKRAEVAMRGYARRDFPWFEDEPAAFAGLKLYFRDDDYEEDHT